MTALIRFSFCNPTEDKDIHLKTCEYHTASSISAALLVHNQKMSTGGKKAYAAFLTLTHTIEAIAYLFIDAVLIASKNLFIHIAQSAEDTTSPEEAKAYFDYDNSRLRQKVKNLFVAYPCIWRAALQKDPAPICHN